MRVPIILILLCSSMAILSRTGDAAVTQPDLPDCAVRYGNLMVDHWLVVDEFRQAERALFYEGNLPSQDRDRLSSTLNETEQQLDQARETYKKLYSASDPAALDQLSRSLDAIESRNATERAEVERLLLALGGQADPKFSAAIVPESALAPNWSPKLIDKHYHPTRVIFGTSGSVSDSRIAALGFDFGKGVGPLGFFAPMESRDKLALPKAITDGTDPALTWMRQHNAGYHYWAGVYNNNNTYVAPWFREKYGSDDDVWMKLADGSVLPGKGDWGQVNIWNGHVRDYIQQYTAVQARTFKDDPSLVCYDYAGEPHPWGPNPPGKPLSCGYNDSAVAAFRAYLAAKFNTIGRLNKAWNTHYAGFESIEPPPDPYVTPRVKASALSYEFERFRMDSYTEYFKLIYDAYRKCDKSKPVEANLSQYMSGWPLECLDAYGLQKAGVVDWIDLHMNNFWPNLPEQIYLYSLCRLTGRVPVMFEYIWTFPRTGLFDKNSESDFRATCEASVWRNLTWGKRVLVFFDAAHDWPSYRNAFLDKDIGYSILRPSACVIPTCKKKALRFNDVLMRTEVVSPPIVVLQPTASVLNSPVLHPNVDFSYHIRTAVHGVHDLLFPKNYPFLYVPEEAVLRDGYDLGKHKVIVLPEAPYLPEAMTDKLLAWVRSGGTLVSVGVPGIWNPYGQDDLRLVTQTFGPSEVTDTEPGKWVWSWKILQRKPSVEWAHDPKTGALTAAYVRYGKGTILIGVQGFEKPQLTKLLYETIDKAIGQRPARCARDSFELVLREDKQGRRYLFALNPDTREVREDEVILAERCAKCVDLGVGSGVPVPHSSTHGGTRFRLRLYPGEGTVVALTR